MKKIITICALLVSASVFSNQFINCYGQNGQSLISINIAKNYAHLTYEWDGASEEEIETQRLDLIYANEKAVGYRTISGSYQFEVQLPYFVLNRKIENFYILVRSDIGNFDKVGEVFKDCTSVVD